MEIGSVLIHKFSNTPWAIHPSMFDTFNTVFNNKLLGMEITGPAQRIRENVNDPDDDYELLKYDIYGNTAVIPMHGVIMKKRMGMRGCSGMVATLDMEASFKSALENRDVERIILDIDSPGGTVDGTKEIADLIYESRGIKKIIAYANGMACSGAMWIGSAAEEFYTYDTSTVGSIGVYIMHVDQSKYNEEMGIKVSYVQSGKYKTIGNPHEPLDDLAKDTLQQEVDYIYGIFTKDVARNRGIAHEEILKVSEGKCFIGEEAVAAGLVDGIEVFDDIIAHSNVYSFLKGEQMLGMKVKDAKATDVKSENAETYNEIFEAGKASRNEEVAALTTANNELTNEKEKSDKAGARKSAIATSAKALGLETYGAELAASDISTEEAYAKLIQKSSEKPGTAQDFAATAAAPAGSADGGDLPADTPKNSAAAKAFCQKRDGSTNKEALRQAKIEFSGLFYGDSNTDGGN